MNLPASHQGKRIEDSVRSLVQRETFEKTGKEWKFRRKHMQSFGASFHVLFPVKVKPGVITNNSNICGSLPKAEELAHSELKLLFLLVLCLYCLNPHSSVLGINLNLEIAFISFEQYADKLKIKLSLKHVLPFTKVIENWPTLK